jgi:HPt (histidine-containing phosphotransfer) domain-containing protein
MTLDAYHAQMAAIRDRFAGRVGVRVADMRAMLARIQQGAQNLEDMNDLHRGLHDLAGTAPSVGFAEIGAEARELETIIVAAIKGGGTPSAEDMRQLSDGTTKLQALADAAQALGGEK